jgi:hypothetical protein
VVFHRRSDILLNEGSLDRVSRRAVQADLIN